MQTHETTLLEDILQSLREPKDEQIIQLEKEVIERAKKITSTFEEANTGLVVIDGKLIEKPVLREMYRILSIANKLNN